MRPERFPELSIAKLGDILGFIRHHELTTAHYWGYADKRLILSLKELPGFRFGVTDYHDRWHRGAHFFNDDYDERDPPHVLGSEFAIPDWLNGVKTYYEGTEQTNFIIDDLEPEPRHKDSSLREFLSDRAITHIAVVRRDPRRLREGYRFRWARRAGVFFGIRLRILWRSRGLESRRILPPRVGCVPAPDPRIKLPGGALPNGGYHFDLWIGLPEGSGSVVVPGQRAHFMARERMARLCAGPFGRVGRTKVKLRDPLVLSFPQLDELQRALFGRPLTSFEPEWTAEFDLWVRDHGYDGLLLFDLEISNTMPEEVVRLAP